jgi:hypothetical protein
MEICQTQLVEIEDQKGNARCFLWESHCGIH